MTENQLLSLLYYVSNLESFYEISISFLRISSLVSSYKTIWDLFLFDFFSTRTWYSVPTTEKKKCFSLRFRFNPKSGNVRWIHSIKMEGRYCYRSPIKSAGTEISGMRLRTWPNFNATFQFVAAV
jgi:hypothetical protein